MARELTFHIGELLQKPQGTKEEHVLNTKPDFSGELKLKSNVKGKIILMAMHEEIHVEVRNLEVETEQECSRCLKQFTQKLEIPLVAAEFLLGKPTHTENEEDFFLIDKKDMTIDLTEMLRQEIVLHSPSISVCSKSCKGLCPKCGADLNKEKCGCKIEAKEDRPLSVLKHFSPKDH